MARHVHQRLVAAAAVMVLVLFAAGAATAVGEEPTDPATDKTDLPVFDPQATVVTPGMDVRIVYVATGENFPDALGAGPAAASFQAPILLVGKNSIPEPTRVELQRLKPDEIVIAGGTAVISPSVEAQLGAYANAVTRLAGANRYETAAEITWYAFPPASMIAVYDVSTQTVPIADVCTNYTGLTATINAPGPGTIIVEANINLKVNHNQNQAHDVHVLIAPVPTGCTQTVGFGADHGYFHIGPEPTGNYYPWMHLKRMIRVTASGSYPLYVTGYVGHGITDAVSFYWGYLDAVYIPAPGA